MLIRHTTKSDLAAVMTILEVGRCRMREAGNATQWADDYPSQAQIMADIEAGCSYIGEEDGRPMVTFACVLGPELLTTPSTRVLGRTRNPMPQCIVWPACPNIVAFSAP
ncbi:hypothetical protein [Hoylesella marshii]|uniref:hypothetical protein n=1 Tax=Hoylesella marshii TaxID=189722 RepID=UPI001EE1F3FF|nr:hypothetical protein [Hoylesella marshii]